MANHSPKKVILITGCSSGFGLLIAARLASQGHDIIASMRDLNKNKELLAETQKRRGKVEVIFLDVTNNKSIQDAVHDIVINYEGIDVLINNAGYGVGGFFEDLSEEDIRDQMETNFFGVQNVTRVVLPIMRKQKSGHIINISSIAGLSATPCFSAYNASKWALEAFSESLYHELKFFNIHVSCVEPGTYKTKIFDENAKYAKDFDNPQSPYFQYSQHLKQKVRGFVDTCHKDPEAVPRLIERLIGHPNPPLRNIPDMESRILYTLRRILPLRLYTWMIRKTLFG